MKIDLFGKWPKPLRPWDKKKYIKKEIPCAHDRCPECHGTGRKKNGEICVHMISCRCPKCNPYI